MSGTATRISLDELIRKLDDAAVAVQNPDPVLRTIGFQIQESTVRQFATGKDPYGNTWAKRADGTVSRLQGRTGELSASISYNVQNGVLHVGSDKKYAPTHQEGKMIYARNAEHLHIPLNDEAAREGPRRLYQRGMFKIRKGGGGVAVIEEDGQLKPMFLLAKQVYIRQRQIFPDKHRGLPTPMWNMIQEIIADHVAGVL